MTVTETAMEAVPLLKKFPRRKRHLTDMDMEGDTAICVMVSSSGMELLASTGDSEVRADIGWADLVSLFTRRTVEGSDV